MVVSLKTIFTPVSNWSFVINEGFELLFSIGRRNVLIKGFSVQNFGLITFFFGRVRLLACPGLLLITFRLIIGDNLYSHFTFLNVVHNK